MTNAEIITWIELLDIELRGGLPAGERKWTRAKIAELKQQLDDGEEEA